MASEVRFNRNNPGIRSSQEAPAERQQLPKDKAMADMCEKIDSIISVHGKKTNGAFHAIKESQEALDPAFAGDVHALLNTRARVALKASPGARDPDLATFVSEVEAQLAGRDRARARAVAYTARRPI